MFFIFLFHFVLVMSEPIKSNIDESGMFNVAFKASDAEEKPPIYYAGVINPDEYISNNAEIPLSQQCLFNVNVSKDYMDSKVHVFLKEHNMSFGILNVQQDNEFDEVKITIQFDRKAAYRPNCLSNQTIVLS